MMNQSPSAADGRLWESRASGSKGGCWLGYVGSGFLYSSLKQSLINGEEPKEHNSPILHYELHILFISYSMSSLQNGSDPEKAFHIGCNLRRRKSPRKFRRGVIYDEEISSSPFLLGDQQHATSTKYSTPFVHIFKDLLY